MTQNQWSDSTRFNAQIEKMSKEYLEYYPNKIAKDNKFEKHLKDEKRFQNESRDQFFEDEKVGVIKAFIYQEFHIWKEWKEKGKNIFHFSENITELLKETDILDTDLSLIKLPYTSFYIDLSVAKIPFVENGDVFIEGAFIRDEHDDGDKGNSFQRAINIDFVSNEYIEKYWTINKDLDWDIDRGFHSICLFLDQNDNLITINDAVKFNKDHFVGNPVVEDRSEDIKIDLYLIHKQFVDRTINFIINCLFYLTTKDADVKEKYTNDLPVHLKTKLEKANTRNKKENATSEILKFGFTKIKYVGQNLQITRKNGSVSDKELATHWRRGHWRNQKFGLNLNESKLLWIMPTIVNKEKGKPEKGHIYEIN